MRKWREQETGRKKEERNYFMLAQITSHLGFLERDAENWEAAIDYMSQWREAVSDPTTINRWIDIFQKELEKAETRKAEVKPAAQ